MVFEKELEVFETKKAQVLAMGGKDKIQHQDAGHQGIKGACLLWRPAYSISMNPRQTRTYISQALEISQGTVTRGISRHKQANWPTKF